MWAAMGVILILLITVLLLMGLVFVAKRSSTGTLMASSGQSTPAMSVKTELEMNFVNPSLIACVLNARDAQEILKVSRQLFGARTETAVVSWTWAESGPALGRSGRHHWTPSDSTHINVNDAMKKYMNEVAPSMSDTKATGLLTAQSKNITQLVTNVVDRKNELRVFLKKFLNSFLTRATLQHPSCSEFLLEVKDGSFKLFTVDHMHPS
tara:strand:+ start:1335 stop:1961 length:627 start_codon:yes stop_codon:yes gene_type:complete